MAKVSAKGRSKNIAYINLHRGVTGSKAWKDLSCEARCLLLEIWGRHNGKNNGQISYSWREARSALRIGQKKVRQAFYDLQSHGFLVLSKRGSFDWKASESNCRASEWRLTAESCGNQSPTLDYRTWKPDDKIQNADTDAVAIGYYCGTHDDETSN